MAWARTFRYPHRVPQIAVFPLRSSSNEEEMPSSNAASAVNVLFSPFDYPRALAAFHLRPF
jgi:hypothetical protein